MSPKDFEKFLTDLEKKIAKETPKITATVASDLLGRFKRRIHNKGLNSNNAKIGNYSTRPFFMRRNDFARKKPKGSGMFFKGGYAESRKYQGFQNSYVDLQYSGELFRNTQNVVNGSSVEIAVLGSENIKKTLENEARFGVIYELTKEEEEFITQKYEDLISELI